MPHLFCFGYGYTARNLAQQLAGEGWRITATHRTADKAGTVNDEGGAAVVFSGSEPIVDASELLSDVSHILVSAPPDDNGDPVLRHHGEDLVNRSGQLEWIGYLSTTSVYGDRGGEWVDETSDLKPTLTRGRRRVDAERAWMGLAEKSLPVNIFRLAGIYGPDRNQLKSVKTGRARRIVKPDQVFGRVHIDDIIAVLCASIAQPVVGGVYNVCDDEPAPPQDVIAYAAKLLNMPLPPEIKIDDASLSDMARSFYAENKRVSNAKIKQQLGVRLSYPTYREGLDNLMQGF